MNAKAEKQDSILCSIAAQEDNLGDIVIRQAMMDWLGRCGAPVLVYTGAMGRGYIDTFHFPDDTTTTASAARFELSLIRKAVAGQMSIVFAPGPVNVSWSVPGLITTIQNAVNVRLALLRGGRVAIVGRAFRGSPGVRLQIERRTARRASLFLARDAVSVGLVGGAAQFSPDLGFYADAPFDQSEHELAVMSFRGDRKPDEDRCVLFADNARSHGLEPVFLTQVYRDDEPHAMLARRLDVRHVGWGDRSHAEQLARVEETFMRAGTVFSNRLHSLVMGARRGAVPIGLREPGHDKLEATLGPVVSYFSQEDISSVMGDLDMLSRRTVSEVEVARQTLIGERDRFVHILSRAGDIHR